MKTKQVLLTQNRFSRPARRLASVKGIVIHYTENPGQSAYQVYRFFESLKNQSFPVKNGKPDYTKCRYGSAHTIVDFDGTEYQCLPISEMAYHVGADTYTPDIVRRLSKYPNDCTLGIELCHRDISGKFTDSTFSAAAERAAKWCKRFSLNPDTDVYRHFDITGKNCPAWFVTHPEDWECFKQSVKAFLNDIQNEYTEV